MVDCVGPSLLCGLGLQRHIVAGETVKPMFMTPEQYLYLVPDLLVEAGLLSLRKAHQNEVPNQVRGTKVKPRGVQAFENGLRIVVRLKGNVDDYESIDAGIDRLRIHGRHTAPKILVIFANALGRLRWWLNSVEQSTQGFMVMPAQDELRPIHGWQVSVTQELSVESGTREIWVGVSNFVQVIPERSRYQHHRCQPLLSVDEQPAREMGGRVVRGGRRRSNQQSDGRQQAR